MEPPYRGPGGYGPPLPCPADEEGEGSFDGKRGDYEEGGYAYDGHGGREDRFGRGDDEEGFGRRRGEERFGRGDDDGEFGRRRGEGGRFGRGDDEEGYPLEPPPGFPDQGFHGQARRQHEGYEHDAYNAADDEFPQLKSSTPQFEGSDSRYSKQPSTEYTHEEPQPIKKEPVAEASLRNQMETLSLDLPQGRLEQILRKETASYNLAVEHNSLQMRESNSECEVERQHKGYEHDAYSAADDEFPLLK